MSSSEIGVSISVVGGKDGSVVGGSVVGATDCTAGTVVSTAASSGASRPSALLSLALPHAEANRATTVNSHIRRVISFRSISTLVVDKEGFDR